jgi:DNA-binding response OmpR family regulator
MSPARLLLVEDDREVRTVLADVLRRAGYTVEEAGTRSESDGLLGSQPYDLVVLDARLPDGSAIAIAEDRARQGRPTLVITGYPDAMHQLVGAGLPYLPKPFKPSKMVEQVKRLLRG